MEPGPYQQVPLTGDEKDFLLSLYDKRRRFIFLVYLCLMAMAFACSSPDIGGRSRYSRVITKWEDISNEDARHVSRLQMWVINLLWLEGMITVTGVSYYLKKIRPLKTDATIGLKDKVPYRIIRKEYDLLHSYYVALDDPIYMHQLLSEDSYNNCNVGDYVYVYRTPKSKFIFEPDGRYDQL